MIMLSQKKYQQQHLELIEKLSITTKNLEDRNEQLLTKTLQQEELMKDLKQTKQTLEFEINSMNQTKKSLEIFSDELKTSKNSLEQEMHRVSNSNNAMSNLVEELNGAKKELMRNLEELKTVVQVLREEKTKLASDLQELQFGHKKLLEDVQSKETALDEAKALLKCYELSDKRKDDVISKLEVRSSQYEHQLAAVEDKLNLLTSQFADKQSFHLLNAELSQKVEELQKKAEKSRMKRRETSSNIKSLQNTLVEVQSDLKIKDQHQHILQQEQNNLLEKFSVLQNPILESPIKADTSKKEKSTSKMTEELSQAYQATSPFKTNKKRSRTHLETESESETEIHKQTKKTKTKPKYVICLSGFKENSPTGHDLAFKETLIKHITNLNAEVRTEAEYDNSITHVVTPPKTRTMKALAAILTQRWLMTPDWITKSAECGYFLPEDTFGRKVSSRPIENKTFLIAESFRNENSGNNATRFEYCSTLIEQLGRGKIVTEGDADFVLISSKNAPDKDKFLNIPVLTWNQFIDSVFRTDDPICEQPPKSPIRDSTMNSFSSVKLDTPAIGIHESHQTLKVKRAVHFPHSAKDQQV